MLRSSPVVGPVWFVAFCDPDQPPRGAPWRDRLLTWALRAGLKPGFRHCYALRRGRAGGWILFNPHSARTDILEFPDDSYPERMFADAAVGRGAVVAVAARRPATWVPRGCATCVTAVAHLIGAPTRPWTTPFALYRHLKQEEFAMGGMFSTPKADTSAADAATAKAQAEADKLKAKNDAALRNLKAGSGGRSLLAFSGTGETGVKTTLGAG